MKKILFAISVLVLSLLLIGIGSIWKISKEMNEPLDATNTKNISFTIEQGQGVRTIADNLENAGLISGSDYFKLYLWKTGLGSKLKAGEYQLSPSMAIADMVELFTGGEIGIKSNEVRVVIQEGNTDEEILDKLKKAEVVSHDSDIDELDIDTSKYAFLADKPENTGFQGFLFPDTYNFYKDKTLEDAVTKMLDEFDSKLTADMRADIKKAGRSTYETITLASIIEKEAGKKEEMPLIASVFYNRLSIGQMLQSDATVNYVTHAGRAMPTSEDLEVDSPYNTYKYTGLPPTPICNPGIDAIRAAIYPADTDYYYFLTTQDETKTTYFSTTYEEHLANKAKYLK